MVATSEIESAPAAASAGWVEIGRVVRPAGLDGTLLVQLHGDDPANLSAATELRLDGPPGAIPFLARKIEPAGHGTDGRLKLRVSLAGLKSRERAEAWSGAALMIPQAALAELPEGEFYWRDLIGLSVRTLDGRALGRVEEIWPTGSNDVLVVRDGSETVLLPALRSLLVSVDPKAGEIRIDPPDGLLPDVD